jgi:hypothetical protein
MYSYTQSSSASLSKDIILNDIQMKKKELNVLMIIYNDLCRNDKQQETKTNYGNNNPNKEEDNNLIKRSVFDKMNKDQADNYIQTLILKQKLENKKIKTRWRVNPNTIKKNYNI